MRVPVAALFVGGTQEQVDGLVRQILAAGVEIAPHRASTPESLEAALRTLRFEIVLSSVEARWPIEIVNAHAPDVPLVRLGAPPSIEAEVEEALRERERRDEAKRMRAQLLLSDRMVAIGVLAAGVGHEINNPLAVISANIEIL